MTKTCEKCGRLIEPRKKWRNNWENIKYCSERCRRARDARNDYEEEILQLLKLRGRGKSICPSEVLSFEFKQDKEKMEEARQAARRLVAQGKIVITQNSQVVDPSKAKGPIRLRLL